VVISKKTVANKLATGIMRIKRCIYKPRTCNFLYLIQQKMLKNHNDSGKNVSLKLFPELNMSEVNDFTVEI
jgi:hypothetical protein